MSGPARRIAPPDFLASPEIAAVLAALPGARLVGGAVRDTLLGLPVGDIDLATPWPPQQVRAALERAGLPAIPTGLAHGTITTLAGPHHVEITTLRRDVATDGRHARVAFTDAWEEDAKRRDFTLNALSMTPDGAVFDTVGGLADLAAGRVRFVGDPGARLAEDYLRLLRFFRFQARFARTPPDAATRAALQAAIPGLARLSAERVWAELKRLLATPDPAPAIALMAELGVLAAIIPEGADPSRALPAQSDPILRLAALLTGDPARLADRLRLSRAERKRLIALRAPPPDPERLAAALAETPPDILAGRALLAGNPALAEAIRAHEIPQFPLSGEDALAAGIPEGPEIGKALAELRRWWQNTNCTANPTTCRAELSRYAASRSCP
jgi:poly(A) polymerase/tRNA nucleotidyltransferase (CCA-adding enzyme)